MPFFARQRAQGSNDHPSPSGRKIKRPTLRPAVQYFQVIEKLRQVLLGQFDDLLEAFRIVVGDLG
jgi:hypothetical protein